MPKKRSPLPDIMISITCVTLLLLSMASLYRMSW